MMHNLIKNLLKRAWTGLLIVSLLMFGAAEGKQLRQVQADQSVRYGIDKRPVSEVQEQKTPDRFTQTTAHLQTKEVKSLLLKQPSSKYLPYLNIIFDCLVKEQELKDSHYVFYHTTPSEWRLAQDVFSQLYAWKYPERQKPEDFVFLRFSDFKEITPRDFLLNELKEHGLVDNRGELAALLLSVNLSLFGSMDWSTSSTWDFFLTELSKKAPSRQIYEGMMDKFGLTHKYIDELLSLVKLYETKENTLLQIFVPQDKVDEFGYVAWSLGIPKHGKTIAWVYDYLKKKSLPIGKRGEAMGILAEKFRKDQENPIFKDLVESVKEGDFSLDAFLKIYRNTPWKIEEIDHAQARLIFTPNGLLNPASGIQFYRYSTASKIQLREYYKRLNEIMDKIFAESGKGGANV